MNGPLTRAALRAGAGACPRQVALIQKRFSSGGHDAPSINHNVKESFGPSFIALSLAIPVFTVLYHLGLRSDDGEDPVLSRWLHKYSSMAEAWRDKNAIHDAAIMQAGHDRNLLMYVERPAYHDLRTPDLIHRHSTRNFPASSHVNLEKAKEVYRRKYYAEEERKAAAMARRQGSESPDE